MIPLTNENFLMYAIKNYNNPSCSGLKEFNDDLKRIRYVKRLLGRFQATGEIKERLVLNHIIVLYNTFGQAATRMIFLKLEGYYDLVKPFLILLGYMPEVVTNIGNDNYTGRAVDIPMNGHIVKLLRTI